MTTARKTMLVGVPLGLIVAFAVASGAARVELAGKEDRAAHDADIVRLQGADRDARDAMRDVLDTIRADRSLRELRAQRDSITLREILRTVTDLACEQSPRGKRCDE